MARKNEIAELRAGIAKLNLKFDRACEQSDRDKQDARLAFTELEARSDAKYAANSAVMALATAMDIGVARVWRALVYLDHKNMRSR